MRSLQTRVALLLLIVVTECLAFQSSSHFVSSKQRPAGSLAFTRDTVATTRTSSSSRTRFARHPRRSTSATSPALQALFIDDLTSAYSYGMANYYLATQSMTGGVLCGIGDALAQFKERIVTSSGESDNKEDEDGSAFDFASLVLDDESIVDLPRLFRFALKGLGGGILWSQWYGAVDGWSLALSNDFLHMVHVDVDQVGDGLHRIIQTLTAILLEQFVACPLVYSLWDIPFPMVMNGSPPSMIAGQVKQKVGPLLVENAKVWSFVNVIIYNLPVEYRLVTMGVADVFWQSVIASVAADAVVDAADKNEKDEINQKEAAVLTAAPPAAKNVTSSTAAAAALRDHNQQKVVAARLTE